MWEFSTEPGYQEKLDWAREFVMTQVRDLEVLGVDRDSVLRLEEPLRQQVKDAGLWAAHLPPELGGGGMGQVKLALLHEILGQAFYASEVFGNMAPDSGNAELIAVGATGEQKERWLYPLLEGKLRSAFSMTEPGAGADPTLLSTRAVREGDEWVINGHKWFTSNGPTADFLIVMAVTDPDAPPHHRASMFIVPRGTPGVNVLRTVGTMAEPCEHHLNWSTGDAEILYEDVRVPADHIIGQPGEGFVLAQKRLGPGRIHHCMRWIGMMQRAFDMMCERSLSRYAHGSLLSEKQSIQNYIADCAAQMHAARLMTLHASWTIDQAGAPAARTEIAMIKYFGSRALFDVVDKAIQVHGSLGYSTDLPLELMFRQARSFSIVDGPDEIHRVTVARRILRGYQAREVPAEHIPTRAARARERFADALEALSLNR
ncbi:MAG TPA: acyl-CoA dehydrogenase family protein [Streptosporangiaceae bacterium]|nr:acyl-CoA dehydrogenase family protein [Streptosporangiaceae bacterium]